MDATIASTIGFALSACANYWLNYHVTFSSSKPHLETAGKFAAIAALGLALNAIAATAIVLLWNFSGNYLWSFREDGPRDY
jgi:putative flippase GtrA